MFACFCLKISGSNRTKTCCFTGFVISSCFSNPFAFFSLCTYLFRSFRSDTKKLTSSSCAELASASVIDSYTRDKPWKILNNNDYTRTEYMYVWIKMTLTQQKRELKPAKRGRGNLCHPPPPQWADCMHSRLKTTWIEIDARSDDIVLFIMINVRTMSTFRISKQFRAHIGKTSKS